MNGLFNKSTVESIEAALERLELSLKQQLYHMGNAYKTHPSLELKTAIQQAHINMNMFINIIDLMKLRHTKAMPQDRQISDKDSFIDIVCTPPPAIEGLDYDKPEPKKISQGVKA